MGRYRKHVEASEYEDFVKSVFDSLVEKEVGTVHLHRRLIGKRTGHEHEIDVVIEARIASLQILILIECKQYKRSVEIGDVLELAQRIDDIGAHKGVMVSTVGFQEGALRVARGHGIALVLTEPVWRHVLYSRSGDVIHGYTVRGTYVGGDSDSDFLIGTTVVAMNFPARMLLELADAWKEVIDCLVADCEDRLKAEYLAKRLRNQYSIVCPFCGEHLRSPRARQCRHCGMDWHDLENIYCRQRGEKREGA